MNHRRTISGTSRAILWLPLGMAIFAGCWSVPRNPDKPALGAAPDSSSGKDPTVPRNPSVAKSPASTTATPTNAAPSSTSGTPAQVSAKSTTSSDPATPSNLAAADAASSPEVPKKSTSVTASLNVSDTRQDRLGQVAGDFEKRRDEAQYQAALNRWREDDAAGCRQQLETLLARNPEHHPARLLLAEVALSQSAAALALEQTRQVLASEQNNAQAHHLMALALDAMGEPAGALKHYERAATLAPGVEAYVVAYQSALDAAVLPAGVRGEAPTAATPQSRAISAPTAATATTAPKNPTPTTGVRQTGYAPEAARTETAAQASFAEPVEKSDPAVERRLTEFRGRIARDPDNPQIALSGAVYALRHEQPAVAVELISPALSRHPESASLYRVLGAAQYRQGNFPAAQVALAKALSLDKSDPLAYFLMGTTLARLGEAEAAERHFAEAARLDPRYGQNRN